MIINQYVNKISIKKTITLYKWEKYKIFYNFILFKNQKNLNLKPLSHTFPLFHKFFSLSSFLLLNILNHIIHMFRKTKSMFGYDYRYVNKISIIRKKKLLHYINEKNIKYYITSFYFKNQENLNLKPLSHIFPLFHKFFSLSSFYLKSCVLNNAFFFFFFFFYIQDRILL